MTPIRQLGQGISVQGLVDQLAANPLLWDQHRDRTQLYMHTDVSDIWVRCAENAADMRGLNPHDCIWYPAFHMLPALNDLVWPLMHFVRGERLGGILITRIPAGRMVRPHVDQGWHAGYFDKFAIQLKGNEKQKFCFNDVSLITMPGDIYTFDNSQTHWVTNDSDEERITLIVCIKTTFQPRRVRS